ERYLDPEPPEFLCEQALHTAVDPLARQQMVARPQHRQMRQGDGTHPARQEDRRLRALERGEALRDRRLVRVVAVAGVEDFGGGADRIGERAALVQGRHHRRPVGAGLGVAVDRTRREPEAALHASVSAYVPPGRRAARRWATSSSSNAAAAAAARAARRGRARAGAAAPRGPDVIGAGRGGAGGSGGSWAGVSAAQESSLRRSPVPARRAIVISPGGPARTAIARSIRSRAGRE